MNRRSWVLAIGIVAICHGSAAAWVFTWPVTPDANTGKTPGKGLTITGKSPDRTKALVGVGAVIQSGHYSTPHAAKLVIFNSNGGTQCVSYPLPEAGWVRSGGGSVYTDRQQTSGPVTKAQVAPLATFTLRGSAAQPVDYVLGPTAQGSVGVRFVQAIGRMCPPNSQGGVFALCSTDADCGGVPGSCQESTLINCENFINPRKDRAAMNGRRGLFVSKTAEALVPEGPCPAPPPGCSPSGAFIDSPPLP